MGDGFVQKIRAGSKISIKNGDVVAVCLRQSGCQCARFIAITIITMDKIDVDSLLLIFSHKTGRNRAGFVGGVVKQLNVEFVGGVLEGNGRFQQPLHHILLIINRQLHRHRRPFGWQGRDGLGYFPMPPIKPDSKQPHHPINGDEREQQDVKRGKKITHLQRHV